MRTMTQDPRRMRCRVLLAAAFALFIAASATPAIDHPPSEVTTGGIAYQELQEGEGAPAVQGQIVQIHLILWIDEGGQKGKKLFDSRQDQGPITFLLGTDKVMPAFNEGVLGMKAGGRRLLMVPPRFAYGKRGVDQAVPPDASLILQIDLLAVENRRP